MANLKNRRGGKVSKKNMKKLGGPVPELAVIDPDVAGIDIGSRSHFVAVPADRSETPVREFGSFTANVYEMVEWLKACRIRKVAMESTGVYWIPVYDILEMAGFEVTLVNARHVKNVSGRKSDVLDCQWIQQLHAFGLLRGAFRPKRETVAVRTLVRTRDNLVRGQSHQIQLIQKAYTEMNMSLQNVLSDIAGVSGMAITRAIVNGERSPKKLAALCDVRVQATAEEVAGAFLGEWLPEQIMAMTCALGIYDAYTTQIAACDQMIEAQLAKMERHEVPAETKRVEARQTRNAPKFDVQIALHKMLGVDLTRVDGIGISTALVIASEIGFDLSAFPSGKHFASWTGVSPGTRITGGKVISGKVPKSHNRVGQALRLAASSLKHSNSALGGYYRRMCAKLGKKSGIVATAHKLARIVYALLTKGQAYVDAGQAAFEESQKKRARKSIERRAKELGFTLVPTPAV